MYKKYRFKIAALIAVISLIIADPSGLLAQAEEQKDGDKLAIAITPPVSDVTDTEDYSITAKDVTRWSILGLTAPVTFLIGVKAWDWGDNEDPFSDREYWFGENTDYGGSDKAGHFLAHYIMQRATYSVFDWTEDGKNSKWVYSLGTTFTMGFLIELGDSYSSHYGFGVEDLVMDYTGILIGALLDYSPILDGFFGFSIEYIPSKGYISRFDRDSLMTSTFEFVNDYSGMQYMMNFKPAGFKNLGIDVPFAIRILSIDVGWYTKGYSTSDRGEYARKEERDFFVGVSINSAQLLSELWPVEHRNVAYTVSHEFLEYYHLPYDRLPIPTRYVNDLNK